MPVPVPMEVQVQLEVQLEVQMEVQLEVQLEVQMEVQMEGRQVPASAGPEAHWVAPHQLEAESVEYLGNREAAAVR